MMRLFGLCLLCFEMLGTFGTTAVEAKPPGGESLKRFFEQLKVAHFSGDLGKKAALTLKSFPKLADWSAVLNAKGKKRFDAKLFTKQAQQISRNQLRLAGLYRFRKGATDFFLNQATTRQLRSRKHKLPGGMGRIAKYLRAGITWYRIKIVKPGRTLGISYTAFAFINGRWVFFPKPWRYIRDGR